MKLFFYLLSILTLFVSCNNKNDSQEQDIYEIVSIIINRFSKPIQPPPPPDGKEPYFSQAQIDSIMNRTQKVALYPVLFTTTEKFTKNEKLGQEYNKLVNDLGQFNSEDQIDINKVRTSKSINLQLVDTIKLKSNRRYIDKNYDILIRISNISFNDSLDKAVLIIGSSRGYLNGASSLIFLEKINGIWKIKNIDTFSIS
ncbi:hypothetical protein [uncultured Aquimarina sp.]|uniref:hypothetical protein n=1 Tax=uncultured Aquimarina sp. TaxID=575652 RepID=UPI00260A69DF|nr:hypothetical protein [uncultured Aquimarina sp.]